MSTIFTDEKLWRSEWEKWHEANKNDKICARCLYHEKIPSISFNSDGVCNYCEMQDQLKYQYQTTAGYKKFKEIVSDIKRKGSRKKYDVIVGVSGGCDSSYLLYLAHDFGLRALAVHFDNTYNSCVAVENIDCMLKGLNIELWTHVVNNDLFDDLYRSFLLAGVIESDAPSDIGLATTLNMAAQKYGVQYIFEGHSFNTEGVSPLGWSYMDAKYIQSVHKQYGQNSMKGFPNLWFSAQLKWMLINQIKKIRPLWYIDYNKEATKKFLNENFGWKWYGGHHLENQISSFGHSYYMPRRFRVDQRVNGYSGMIRSKQMTKEEGTKLIHEAPTPDLEAVVLIKKRLKLSDDEFIKIMQQPHRTYKDYKTYKPLFEKLRPFFYLLAKMELIPMSFYLKYTAKDM